MSAKRRYLFRVCVCSVHKVCEAVSQVSRTTLTGWRRALVQNHADAQPWGGRSSCCYCCMGCPCRSARDPSPFLPTAFCAVQAQFVYAANMLRSLKCINPSHCQPPNPTSHTHTHITAEQPPSHPPNPHAHAHPLHTPQAPPSRISGMDAAALRASLHSEVKRLLGRPDKLRTLLVSLSQPPEPGGKLQVRACGTRRLSGWLMISASAQQQPVGPFTEHMTLSAQQEPWTSLYMQYGHMTASGV